MGPLYVHRIMGLKTRKGIKGTSAKHLTRASALKKLQVSLADFRRLCILKGVYPRDPKRKLHGKDKTYYHAKDILYLHHEPVLQKLREIRAFERKYKRALGRQEKSAARSLQKQRPVYELFHIVKERYPTLLDAVRDLDDALSTVALFSSLPASDEVSVSASTIAEATRLFDEFLFFSAEKGLVRKVFCSIKGFYIQIKYLGQHVTFLVPHQLPQQPTAEVDFNVLLTFLEFYRCLLKTVNFKMYTMEGLAYPPTADPDMIRAGCRFLSLTNAPSMSDASSSLCSDTAKHTSSESAAVDMQKKIDALKAQQQLEHERDQPNNGSDAACRTDGESDYDDDHLEGEQDLNNETEKLNVEDFEGDETLKRLQEVSAEDKQVQSLFSGLSFFISREVPRTIVAFLLKSCGADLVAWEGEGSPATISDARITHHIMDRPLNDTLKSYQEQRELVQPQWVFDSINSGKRLPIAPYGPGVPPPPHLSPFSDDLKEGYIPEQRVVLESWCRMAEEEKDEVDDEASENDEDVGEDNVDDVELQEQSYQDELRHEKGTSSTEAETAEVSRPRSSKKRLREAKEEAERERRKTLLSKKHKRLLDKIEFGKRRHSDKIAKLSSRRPNAATSEAEL